MRQRKCDLCKPQEADRGGPCDSRKAPRGKRPEKPFGSMYLTQGPRSTSHCIEKWLKNEFGEFVR